MAGGRSPAPLATLALFSIIRHMWRRSGAEDQLVCYNHAHARHRVGVTSTEHHTMKPYVAIIDRIVTRILELDLPKVLVMQLGNCFIDFERRMVKFSMFLVSALDEATLDNVRAGVRSIVVNQFGHIDKQQTIIDMAFGSVNSTLNPRFTAYHCVSFNRILDLLKEKEAGNVNLEKEIHLRRSFGSPMTYWEPRHLVEGMEGQFLQCVAVHGTNEALEYFLKTIEADQTQVELSRAAVHMLNYDHDFKYTAEEERNTFKKELLADTDFVANLIDTIRQGLMIVDNFQKFLVWACMNNRILVTYYIQKTLLPEKLMNEIFKNYLVSTKRSIYTIDICNLTDMQMRSIRASIAEDSSTLYQYCSDLLKMKDYAALPRMLTCVFQNDGEREQFVRNYFRSYSGIRAIYGMLIDDSFDDRFFCRYQFKVKIAMFLEFKKYWIISETIARDLEEVLVVYGHPMRAADILKSWNKN
ncbi:hypothetical protein JYU34_020904 [Plutella xylostella]|uniref:Uncharacterized protein n=1 Tax=Plutella xylostella TaxID=51655 RepID=A0ABQ7PS77_PLUXY|nr:hypothetical protein JYU34_020904 [Plutella xylostella]